MIKWLTNNLELKLIALLLAVGLVWIKGQERINPLTLNDVSVMVENMPRNLYLPESWIPPEVSLTLHGPKNILELLRPEVTRFRIDLSKVKLPEPNEPVNLLLTEDMFQTNLEERDQLRISVVEASITPSQITLVIKPWNLEEEPPEVDVTNTDQVLIPLLRAQKHVEVIVPSRGVLTHDQELDEIVVDPPSIVMTGDRAALSRIESVSTEVLDLNLIEEDTPPFFLPIQEEGRDVRPVRDDIRGVTVTIKMQ